MEDPRFRETRPGPRRRPEPAADGERLEKVLATIGIAARRDCERLVREGRIRVNGDVVRELPHLVRPERDLIEVDGEEVVFEQDPARRAERLYIALNKPKGVISTADDPDGRVNVVTLVGRWVPRGKRVYPVGRLDADSTGLILLTNDGDLAHRLAHPRFGVAKEYRVTTLGALDDQAVAALRKGMFLAGPTAMARSHAAGGEAPRAPPGGSGGRRAAFEEVRVLKRLADRSRGDLSLLSVTLHEGQNREIRRLLARVGVKVKRLERVAIGPLKLGSLKPGQSRRLSDAEVAALRAAVGLSGRGPRDPRPQRPG